MAKSMYRTEPFGGNTGPSKAPLMRVSYAWQLFKLRDDSDYRPTYGCTLICPVASDWSVLHNAIKECLVKQWGDKSAERWKAGLIKNPILKGDGKEARSKETGDLHPGMGPDVNFIRVTSGRPVTVLDPRGQRIVDPDDLPSGSWGYPVLNAYCWNNAQNGDGISFGISAFMMTKKATGDEVLGGGGFDPSRYYETVNTGDGGDKPESAADLFA